MQDSRADTTCDPVVFLHGLLESPAIWDAQRAVAERYGAETFAPPLPGHRGDALAGPDVHSLLHGDEALPGHLADLIEARCGGRPVRLVGHSLGGLLALCIARARPDLVRDVLVIGTLHAGDCGRTESVGSWLVTRAPALGPVSARLLLRRWVASNRRFAAWMRGSLAPGETLRQPVDTMRRELATADAGTMRAIAIWLRQRAVAPLLRQVDRPVTVIVSARDPIVAAPHQLAVARALPRGIAQVIDSGHLPMLTAPALLGRTLQAWLRSGVRGMARPGRPVDRRRSDAGTPKAASAPLPHPAGLPAPVADEPPAAAE